ncbi:unnamed protein product, partial [Ostreobium quekettii]
CGKFWARVPVFDPDGFFKSNWDWLVVFLVLYIAIYTPFEACFIHTKPPDWDGGKSLIAMKTLGYFSDCVFIMDILFNFNTEFVKAGAVKVSGRREIAVNYFYGFFPVDLISSIPIDWFMGSSNVSAVSMAKCIRLLRLGRLMRKLDQLQAANALRVVKLMFAFMLVCHWVACGWYYIGVHEEGSNDDVDEEYRSWTSTIKHGNGIALFSDNLAAWYQ